MSKVDFVCVCVWSAQRWDVNKCMEIVRQYLRQLLTRIMSDNDHMMIWIWKRMMCAIGCYQFQMFRFCCRRISTITGGDSSSHICAIWRWTRYWMEWNRIWFGPMTLDWTLEMQLCQWVDHFANLIESVPPSTEPIRNFVGSVLVCDNLKVKTWMNTNRLLCGRYRLWTIQQSQRRQFRSWIWEKCSWDVHETVIRWKCTSCWVVVLRSQPIGYVWWQKIIFGYRNNILQLFRIAFQLGTSPLHMAAMNNHLDTCEVLLRAGVSKDARTKVDRTPLHFAVYEGHDSVVELLLKYKCDVNARDMVSATFNATSADSKSFNEKLNFSWKWPHYIGPLSDDFRN